jgi:hypothetical protein
MTYKPSITASSSGPFSRKYAVGTLLVCGLSAWLTYDISLLVLDFLEYGEQSVAGAVLFPETSLLLVALLTLMASVSVRKTPLPAGVRFLRLSVGVAAIVVLIAGLVIVS